MLAAICYSSSSSTSDATTASSRVGAADRYGPNGTPLDPTCRHVTHDRVVDAQDARHLVERAGLTCEVKEVVAPLTLVADLVGELAPPPGVVQVPGATALLHELTSARHDLALTIVVELGVEQQQDLVFVHVPVLLPSV
jgi:hypothetical protein